MNTILLHPTDVLFFRDGRPMEASLAGHGAAWPLPSVVNAAFHAALHRAQFDQDGGHQLHLHRRRYSGICAQDAQRDRKFGSLVTVGPFPVCRRSTWYFPRPLDLQNATLEPALAPTECIDAAHSSLPDPLEYSVGNRLPPSKETQAKSWLSGSAYQRYILGSTPALLQNRESLNDGDFSDSEHTIGIAIDPTTGTTGQGEAAGKFYSAHYLRLREDWQLGVCAAANDKEYRAFNGDLVRALLNGGRHQIVVGGQQRICTAERVEAPRLPLPVGRNQGFNQREGKFLVKWVLLSPAVWPAIQEDGERQILPHPGGWLPNWIAPDSGQVLLKAGDTTRQDHEAREAWRRRVRQQGPIPARLVAALVPKPIIVSGWALADEALGETGGALSTHLAVPAGAIYYFKANSATEATQLAYALNWHGGETSPATVINRRSTLLGEKGFGLGVCSTWEYHP